MRIQISGRIAATSDGAISKLHINSDVTNYQSEGAYGYGGGVGAIALITNGLLVWRQYGTAANVIREDGYLWCGALSGLDRPYRANAGGEQTGVGGFTNTLGGAWTDTSSEATSITFDWAAGFTGNVYILQD